MRNAIHWAMTRLIFVPKEGTLGGGNLDKLGGGMWLRGVDQLILWQVGNNLATIHLTCDHFRDMT